MKKHIYPLWLYVALLLVAFYLRVNALADLPPGLHHDEARNFIRAWRISQGYRPEWFLQDIPEPFDAYARAFLLRGFGFTIFTARLISVFLGVLSVAAVMGTTRALLNAQPQRHTAALVAGAVQASIPSLIILNRAIFRVNWMIFFASLALFLMVRACQRPPARRWMVTGAVSGLAAIFYLAGLVMPALFGAVLLLYGAQHRTRRAGVHSGVAVLAFGVAVSPWLYLYATIPHWLDNRVRAASDQQTVAFSTPADVLDQSRQWVRVFYQDYGQIAAVDAYVAARYNVFGQPLLTGPLLLLLLVGFVTSLLAAFWPRYRRQQGPPQPQPQPPLLWLVPIGAALLFCLPAIATTFDASLTRLSGTYAPVAVLIGLGAAALLQVARFWRAGAVLWVAVGLLLVGSQSVVRAQWAVRYHFTEEPRLFDDPLAVHRINFHYSTTLRDLIAELAAQGGRVFLPQNVLNHSVTMAFLTERGVTQRGVYAGGPVPAGTIVVPAMPSNRAGHIDRPTAYAIVDFDAGQIVLLPPFAPHAALLDLEEQVIAEGTALYNDMGWYLGHSAGPTTVAISPADLAPLPPSDTPPLVVFNDQLALLQFDAPVTITPGQPFPVIFYWQVLANAPDYHLYFQLMENEINRRGGQYDGFAGILRWLYPSSMWPVGTVVPEVRWIEPYDDVPVGGYRFALEVHTYPGPTYAAVETTYGTRQKNQSAIIGQTWVAPPTRDTPPPTAVPVQIGFSRVTDRLTLTHLASDPPVEGWQAGAGVTVRLWWQAETPIAEDYSLFLHVVDETGAIVTQADSTFADTRFTTGTWYAGATLMSTHHLQIPADATGPLRLRLGMYLWTTGERMTVALPNDYAVVENAVVENAVWVSP